MREVWRTQLANDHSFRVVTLICGHSMFRQPAQRIPKRARCGECEGNA